MNIYYKKRFLRWLNYLINFSGDVWKGSCHSAAYKNLQIFFPKTLWNRSNRNTMIKFSKNSAIKFNYWKNFYIKDKKAIQFIKTVEKKNQKNFPRNPVLLQPYKILWFCSGKFLSCDIEFNWVTYIIDIKSRKLLCGNETWRERNIEVILTCNFICRLSLRLNSEQHFMCHFSQFSFNYQQDPFLVPKLVNHKRI